MRSSYFSRKWTTNCSSDLSRRSLTRCSHSTCLLGRGSRLSVRAFVNESSKQRSEEHTSELQSRGHLVCRLLLEKKKTNRSTKTQPHQPQPTQHQRKHNTET